MHEQQQTIAPDMREIPPTAAHYIQSRAQMDFALVDEYAQMMKDGVEFEPAMGINDADGTIYIYDGYHRGEAAKHINALLRVRVIPGTRQDAEWLAFAANKSHGLRRTHADIERIVKNALQHPKAASLSDREIARHCGTDHKTVGNWRKRIAAEAEEQRRADAGENEIEGTKHQANAATQTEIAGAERFWSVEAIKGVLRDYINAHSYAEQIGILQNIIKHTVTGIAYLNEIGSLLRDKDWDAGILHALAKTELAALQHATCETCGTVKERAQMFRQESRWYCSKCFPAIQQQTAAASETATARELEDIENIIMAKLPQNDLALDALREVMMNSDAFDRLYAQLPGFPTWTVKQAISALHKRLSLARILTTPKEFEAIAERVEEKFEQLQAVTNGMKKAVLKCDMCGYVVTGYETPTISLHYKPANSGDTRSYCDVCWEIANAPDDARTQAAIREAQEMAADIAAKQQPAPEMQMRCMACRVMYPESQLTYKTGLCPACLRDQLDKLTADNRMMRAVFTVLERKLIYGLAAEIKRDIYEEIYAPTPEPEAQPEEPPTFSGIVAATPKLAHVVCSGCNNIVPVEQMEERRGYKYCKSCINRVQDDDLTPDPRERVLYYKAQGLSVRKIADALKTEGITLSKSAVDRIIQENKGAQI